MLHRLTLNGVRDTVIPIAEERKCGPFMPIAILLKRASSRPWPATRLALLLIAGVALALGSGGCSSDSSEVAEKRSELSVMNTEAQIVVFGHSAEAVAEAERRIVADLLNSERLLSRYVAASDISRINAAAGESAAVEISDAAGRAIEQALLLSRQTGGAFNPLVGSLVSLWRRAASEDRLPSESEIAAALELLDVSSVELRKRGDVWHCRLPRAGMSLDLGGIGKGWAADEALKVAREVSGVRGALVMIGGDGFGWNADDWPRPWRVGIQDPRQGGRRVPLLLVSGRNLAIVTSGNYERWFSIGGRRYNHIIDPRTGWPVEGEVISATVIAADGASADGLATACIVLGLEEGLRLLEDVGAEGLLMLSGEDGLLMFSSEGMNEYLAEGFEAGAVAPLKK